MALAPVGVTVEDLIRHGQLEDRIPQELEALVVLFALVFVRVGAMCQRNAKRLGVDIDTETLKQCTGIRHGSHAYASATLRPLYS